MSHHHYHLIGIGGIGMSGLAHLLLARGKTVSGSDLNVQSNLILSLRAAGATIYQGHSASYLTPCRTVVYSSDIKPENPEFHEAKQRGYRLIHRAELLAELIQEKTSIAIAGTHGKTTTSSLLATVLLEASQDPSYAIGGVLNKEQQNAYQGSGKHFIFEADESDRSFLHYYPTGAILTNIDDDHLVNYNQNFQLLLESFDQFSRQVQREDLLLWCKDDPHLSKLTLKGQSYGFNSDSDWRILNEKQERFSLTFDLKYKATTYKNIFVKAIGKHNVLNSAAVFALCQFLNIEEKFIRKGLENFSGVARRCQFQGEKNGIAFFDDYAHHPTEIATTLNGLRVAAANKRLIVLFQPHRYSRTKDCLKKYATCFQEADQVIITDIYGAGEPVDYSITAQIVLEELKKEHLACFYIPNKELLAYLTSHLKINDLLVTLGAGDINQLIAKLRVDEEGQRS